MTGSLSLGWLFLLIAVGAWCLGCLASDLASRCVFRGSLSPVARRRRSFIVAAIPLLGSAALVTAVAVTAVGKVFGLVVDHCVYHGPGHPHLCFKHLPAIHPGIFEIVMATLLLVSLVVVVGRFALRERRAGARIRSLVRLASSRSPQRTMHRVADPSPFAVTAGAFTPRVILSRGLLDNLASRDRRMVVAHEFSHVRTRDLFYNGLFEILLLLQWPTTAARLRHQWRQALEEMADDRVADRFGREDVAATLLKVFRLQKDHSIPGLGAAGADPLRRVERLLSPPESTGSGGLFVATWIVCIGVVGVSLAIEHHFLETLLGFLTGH